nr:MAG TPA: Protein of unknown function (DUF551) [Caudoviricetes sp.]
MTSKLTITDERVISVIERLEHYASNLKWTNVRGAQDLLTAADGLRELQERRKPLQDKDLQGVIDALEHPAGINAAGKQVVRHALVELQERRKADSEPVATLDVQSGRPYGNKFALVFSSAAHKLPDDVYFLYRHAQPVPVVSADLLHTAASAIEDLLEHTDPNTSYYSGVWADVPGKLRAAMLAAAPQSPGSEPVTVPGNWIAVSERMPERGDYLVTDGRDFDVQLFNGEQFIPGFVWEDKITHWMPLPATPQEVK